MWGSVVFGFCNSALLANDTLRRHLCCDGGHGVASRKSSESVSGLIGSTLCLWEVICAQVNLGGHLPFSLVLPSEVPFGLTTGFYLFIHSPPCLDFQLSFERGLQDHYQTIFLHHLFTQFFVLIPLFQVRFIILFMPHPID